MFIITELNRVYVGCGFKKKIPLCEKAADKSPAVMKSCYIIHAAKNYGCYQSPPVLAQRS